jgi:hypothetical protein
MSDVNEPLTSGSEKGTITLGRKLSAEEEQQYREKIQRAKGEAGSKVDSVKGSIPVGHVEKPRIPLLKRGPDTQVGFSQQVPTSVTPRPPGSPTLRPETVGQVENLAAAQQKAQEAQAAQEAQKKSEEERSEFFDNFDFAGLQGEAERILNNKKRRKEIESRCSPMKLEDLIMKDEVQQTVPVIPGQFEIVFRSLTPEESLFVKQILAKDNSTSDAYSLEKYSLCLLTCSLMSINGKEFIDHRGSKDNSPDEALFQKKLKEVTKKSMYVIADLGIQYSWFDIRVRRLLAPEALGNG